MVDVLLVIFAILCGVIGSLGSVIPVLPGPPFGYIGLLLMHWTKYSEYSTSFLLLFLLLTLVVTIADNILPVWMTKRYGGSLSATRGSLAGLIVGMFFFPPWGLILGSFIGAFTGEWLHNRENPSNALRVGFASFVAFIVGTGAKLTLSIAMFYYMIRPLF